MTNGTPATASYFYTRDHLGSIREMTDITGIIQARYDYDLWGRRTKVSGTLDVDFGFTGYFYDLNSQLCLAPYRAYSADLGRWLNWDPIGESGGLNLFKYVSNNPVNLIDPLGLAEWNLIVGTRPIEQTGVWDTIANVFAKHEAVFLVSGNTVLQVQTSGGAWSVTNLRAWNWEAIQTDPGWQFDQLQTLNLDLSTDEVIEKLRSGLLGEEYIPLWNDCHRTPEKVQNILSPLPQYWYTDDWGVN